MTNLPNKEFRQMVPLLREKDFYEAEPIKEIAWPEYNLSQIEEASDVLDFIRDTVDSCKCLDRQGRVGRPLTEPRNLAKAVLLCEALGFVERASEGWVKIIGPYIGIGEAIDERVIGEAYDRLDVTYILRQVFHNTKSSNGTLCGDGSGLERSRKQNYESAKKYASYMVSIIDSREIVQAFELGNKNEHEVMSKLITQVEGSSIRLDAGFNNRELVKRIAELEMIPYIFPKKSNNLNGSLPWKTMYLELYHDVMTWLTEYHQRSHCESFHSSFKRKNRLLMKLRPLAQLNQVLARIILHNRRRISYFEKLAKAN
jgi:transposase